MYGQREELKAIDYETIYANRPNSSMLFYTAVEADKVMDEMEARIQHLEAILDLDPRTNLSLVNENQQLRDRIKELEAQISKKE